MIHLPTTKTESRRRRHIHKQARLVLPQTVLLRIVPLPLLAFPVPHIRTIQHRAPRPAAHFGEGWFPETRLCPAVSAAWLYLMPPPLIPQTDTKPKEAPFD
jgi:hypothetical protein